MARPGYPVEVRRQAATLRGQGVGRADIARRLGVALSTVCRWFREDSVPFPVAYRGGTVARQRAVAERWAAEQREQDAHRDAVGPLSPRELFLVGVALYWAEGAKSKPWRRSHMLMFCNSDVSVIEAFLAWLDLLQVERSRLRCRVLIHESADVEAAVLFWRDVTGPLAVFTATGIKKHHPKTVRHNIGDQYRGCLVVRVADAADLYRLSAGAWEGIAAAAVASASDRRRSPVV
jgi:AcrR family transcriptional regulator